MSTQKSKKGFTLIELMVVIVIIGILAAIAIPKLFGMSAKAKAQEVGPAMGTWTKLQMAYKMEKGTFGSAENISYKLPGQSLNATPNKSTTSNFSYEAPAVNVPSKEEIEEGEKVTAKLIAENLFDSDLCESKTKWSATLGKYGETAEMNIGDGKTGSAKGCLSLAPSFYNIGCSEDQNAEESQKCKEKESD